MSCSDDQLRFCVYVINQIAFAVGKPTAEIYKHLSETGVVDDYIINCYDTLHTLGREYLVEDITGLLQDRGVIL